MFIRRIFILFFVLQSCQLFGQVEQVLVEKYYVADSLDATDTTGGGILAGTVTYRIFIDLAQGSRLKGIYGDANHALEFSSTQPFFNNKADGQTFAYKFSTSRLGENTVALDSWITLGQITKTAASRTNYGVLKSKDHNGSIIGGIHNDGGSAAIPGGLLINNDTTAGIALITADGYDTSSVIPTGWIDNGFIDFSSGIDSTIFGSVVSGNHFLSNNAFISNNGVTGKDTVSNEVIIAQLTTSGSLSFKLNLLVDVPSASGPKTVKYVSSLAAGEMNSDSLQVSPFLTFPQVCGCTDPAYVEYSQLYACGNQDSCHRLVVFGCMDTTACNFDPMANFNIPSLCCYPGFCNDRNLAVVCPELNNGRSVLNGISTFPNPVKDELLLQWQDAKEGQYAIRITTVTGAVVYTADFIVANEDAGRIHIPFSSLSSGMYLLSIAGVNSETNKLIVKE